MDWLDLLAVQGTLKSLLQHHSSKASILWCSAFFIVQLSHPYVTTGKTTALTRQTFVDKIMSLLFNMLSRLVITFLPRSKCLLISWLQWFCRWLSTHLFFWLHLQAFSSFGEQGWFSSGCVWGFHCGGFSCCRAQAVGHGGSLAAWHVKFYRTMNRICVPYIGRQILNH